MRIKLRWKNPTRVEINAILKCQVVYRKNHGGLAAHMKRQALKYQQEEERMLQLAALRVQGAWRKKKGTYASFLLKRAKADAKKDQEERHYAAVRLQICWRKKKGTFAKHMLKSAQTDVKKDQEIERLRIERALIQLKNKMILVLQRWWKNRHFSQISNLVAAAIEQKRIEDLITKVQSKVRGMICRKWMKRRHEIATTTAAAFRGYVGRMGHRLQKKLHRNRAAKKIQQFISSGMKMKEMEFMKRDSSAIEMQRFIRGYLVRWQSHAHFATAVHLWGLEVLHDKLGRPVGKDTERAVKDGKLLANAIWCRYPCPNPGVMFHAGRETVKYLSRGNVSITTATDVSATKSTLTKEITQYDANTMQSITKTVTTKNDDNDNDNNQDDTISIRKLAWEDRPYMDTFTKETPFMPSTRRRTPQSIGRTLTKPMETTLQPTYTCNQSVPFFTLSRAMESFPLTSENVVRYRVPRKRPVPPPPDVKLAWGPQAAHSLQLDVKSLLASRKQVWRQRHVQNKWFHKKKLQQQKMKRKMKNLHIEVGLRE